MNIYIKYLLIFIIFIIVDSIYLRLIYPLFNKMIKNIQGTSLKLNYYSAFMCYLILVFSFIYFVINKNFDNYDTFLFGFIIYGVYETTSHATLKDWDNKLLIIDSIWGGIIFLINKIIINNIIKI